MDLHYLIDKVLLHDTHRSGNEDRTISVTTLIDGQYRAWKSLNKHEKNHKIPAINKRGSTFGTAFHEYAEKALDTDDVIQEVYAEEYIFEHNMYLTGTFDLLVWDMDAEEYVMADWKTSSKFKFDDDAILKAQKQMSIYRWMNRKKFKIADDGHILFLSTARNVTQDIPIQLLSLEDTKQYIMQQLDNITTEPPCDCPKAWLCNYCEFSCTERK